MASNFNLTLFLVLALLLRTDFIHALQGEPGSGGFGGQEGPGFGGFHVGSSDGGQHGANYNGDLIEHLSSGGGASSNGGGGGVGGAGSNAGLSNLAESIANKLVDKKVEGAEQVNEKVEKDVDIFKHILNPVEFVKAVSNKFKLHFGKFVAAVGKPLVFGLEAALSPFTVMIKIIEKVFVPDVCRLHFICKLGSNISFLKEHVPKFSPKFGEGSSLIRAFGEGILGGDCSNRFVCNGGSPNLRSSFENYKRN